MAYHKEWNLAAAEVTYLPSVPGNPVQYLKTIVAFANSYGGSMVFGMNEAEKVIGLEPSKLVALGDKLRKVIRDGCEPLINPEIFLREAAGKSLLIVTIPRGDKVPYFVKTLGIQEGTYIRRNGKTRPATGYFLKELTLQGSRRSYDSEPGRDTILSSQGIVRLGAVLQAALKKFNAMAALPSLDSDYTLPVPTPHPRFAVGQLTAQVMLSLGLAKIAQGQLSTTRAYDLLLGIAGQPALSCLAISDAQAIPLPTPTEFTGSVLGQLINAYCFWHSKLSSADTKRKFASLLAIPLAPAWNMLSVAVVHRSYLSPGKVRLTLLRDRLEIVSPGFFHNGVAIGHLRQGYFKIRNRALAKTFYELGLLGDWSSGISRLLAECRQGGLKRPEFFDDDGDLRVVIYGRGVKETELAIMRLRASNKLAELDNHALLALDILRQNPKLKQTDLQREMQVSLRTVKKALADLENCGVISRDLAGRNNIWNIFI